MDDYLNDLFLRHMAKKRNRSTPIYIHIEGTIGRQTGGKYKGGAGALIEQVDAVNIVGIGASKMQRNIPGIRYTGVEEFYIPYSELSRLEISNLKELQPIIKLYIDPWVMRVVNIKQVDNERNARVFAERTRDVFPTFTSAWDFSDGEVPTSHWETNEPSNSSISVESEKLLMETTGDVTESPYIEVDIVSSTGFRGKKVSFDLTVDLDNEADDPLIVYLLGRTTILTFEIVARGVDPDDYQLKAGGVLASYNIDGGTTYSFEITVDYTTNEWTITDGSSTIATGDFENDADLLGLIKFVGNPGVGETMKVYIDNLEVSAVA